MFVYPQRESYLYTIKTSRWDIIFDFKQATAEETYDHYELLDRLNKANQNQDIVTRKKLEDRIFNEMYYFLERHIIWVNKSRKYYTKRQVVSLLKMNIEKYYKQVSDLLHKIRESKYNWIKEPISKEEIKNWRRRQLFQNNLEAISKATLIPVDEVTNRLTIEQIGWWHDKLTFDYYETFDEGKKANNLLKGKKWLDKDQQELLSIIKQRKQKKE